MSIKYLPARRDGQSIRDMQARMVELGRIRLGIFNPNKGNRGAPDKLNRFRLTSDDERLIRMAAKLYGGEPEQWTPQRSRRTEWQVITEVNEIPVQIPRQRIEPWMEAWKPNMCVRRCDGEWDRQQDEACVCNGPNPPGQMELCKPTVRVNLVLPELPGFGVWRLESHGEYACAELSALAPYVADVSMDVPAMLRLREETRRYMDPVKEKPVNTTFYVPWLSITAATPAQLAAGGGVLASALRPALAASVERQAIEAGPATEREMVEREPDNEPDEAPALARAAARRDEPKPNMEIDDTERYRILAAIEAADLTKLEQIRSALAARNIRDRAVQDAWVSKRNAWRAVAELEQADDQTLREALANLPPDHQERLKGRLAAVEQEAREDPELYREAVERGATDEAIAEAGGVVHWQAGADQAAARTAVEHGLLAPDLVEEYKVGDEVTVGGLTFTKISEGPSLDDFIDVGTTDEGRTETGPEPDQNEHYTMIFNLAGQRGLTTAQTNDLIKSYCKIEKISEADGWQLRRVYEAMKAKLI
jgi:recombination directionality factor gp3-like protein